MSNSTELPETEDAPLSLTISTKDLAAVAERDKKTLASLVALFEDGRRNPVLLRDDPFDLRPRGIPRPAALALTNTDAWACVVTNRLPLPDVDLEWWDDNLAESMTPRSRKRRLLVIFATAAGVEEWIAFLNFHNPDMPVAVVDGKGTGRLVHFGDLAKREG